MPRKSMANVRREQLLDAFERCILRHGLENTSLEQVADEAGMTRSIIRHYIGNRDDLVEALIGRILLKSAERLRERYAGLTPDESLQVTLHGMFAEQPTISERDRIVLAVMSTTADRYAGAKALLKQAFEALIASFAGDLQRVYADASAEQCRQVAYALVCMSEMNEAFLRMGFAHQYNTDARTTAGLLLKTLE